MLSPVVRSPGLVTGERLTVEEFLRRWEELPDLKHAELIDGVVYVPSPVSLAHGSLDFRIIWWLGHYAQATPGCKGGSNSTWLMSGSAPQPDVYLRILPRTEGSPRTRNFLPTVLSDLRHFQDCGSTSRLSGQTMEQRCWWH
jgi:Uma2 family endonuclease